MDPLQVDFTSAPMQRLFDYDNFRRAGKLETQVTEAMVRPNKRLAFAVSNTAAQGLPPISVRPLAGQYLSILARAMGAKEVLEIGTLGGYGSICFAEAGAKVTSVEISPKHREVALQNVAGLDVDIILGAALDVLPRLAAEGRKFDLVFIDADFDDQWEHFDWAVKLTRPNGAIFLDDVVASMITKDQLDIDENSFVARIGRDERVLATLVPVVATHPDIPNPVFNGHILATVKGN